MEVETKRIRLKWLEQILHFDFSQNAKKQFYFIAAPCWQDETQGQFNVGKPECVHLSQVQKYLNPLQPLVALASVLLSIISH